MSRLLHLMVMVTLGVVGIAPAVVCAMPPECPMWQGPSQDCCTGVVPAEGMTQVSCHPQAVPAVTARVTDAAPTVGPAPLIVAAVPALRAVSSRPETPVPPTAIPRFLLTHTFRL